MKIIRFEHFGKRSCQATSIYSLWLVRNDIAIDVEEIIFTNLEVPIIYKIWYQLVGLARGWKSGNVK